MTDPKEVADRLRAFADDLEPAAEYYSGEIATVREAAATLETLSSELERVTKEVERLRAIVAKDPKTVMIAFEDGDHMRLSRAAGDAIRRAERAEASLGVAVKALEPFADFAERNTDDEGWAGTQCQRERVCDWFGPSDFRAARSARASIQAKGE